jgi:hypothetical protein
VTVERPQERGQLRVFQFRMAGFRDQSVRISRATRPGQPLMVTMVAETRPTKGRGGRDRPRGNGQGTAAQTETPQNPPPAQADPPRRPPSLTGNEVLDPWGN